MTRAAELIATLGLAPHPEGGHFARTYTAALTLDGMAHGGPRAAASAIYFLLGDERRVSRLHRLRSDELFHLYEGGPLEVLLLPEDGDGHVARLGLDLAAGARPQLVIPAGTWFGAELPPGVGHCLWGCTVAPGFDLADFALATAADGEALAQRHPEHADRIARLLP